MIRAYSKICSQRFIFQNYLHSCSQEYEFCKIIGIINLYRNSVPIFSLDTKRNWNGKIFFDVGTKFDTETADSEVNSNKFESSLENHLSDDVGNTHIIRFY